MTSDPLTPLLIDEATKKSGLVWVTTPAGTSPVWLLWHEGAAYVLSGTGEQPSPGLGDGVAATVTVRSKDNGARLLSWDAAVTTLVPGTPEWDVIVALLMGKRLNLVDGEAAGNRWARDCSIHRLSPTGRLAESPEHMPDGSLAAVPLPSPAATEVPIPYTVGRSTYKLPRRRRSS